MSNSDSDGGASTSVQDKLSVLRRERGALRQRFTKFSTFIATLASDLSESQLLSLDQRTKQINAAFDKFEKVQSKIESLCDDEAEYTIRDDVENVYYNTIGEANLKLGCRSAASVAGSVVADDAASNVSGTEVGSVAGFNDCAIKLPTIELPEFNGSYNKWSDYKEIFESLINSNARLSQIQKFHYLRSTCKGEAADIIKNVNFTADNYEVAWKALTDRFDNSKLLLHNHLRSLFDQTYVRKDSFVEIRQCVDSATKNLRALKNLGQPTEHWDTLIIFVICNKIDKSIVKEWEEKICKEESVTLSELLEFLKQRADMLETWSAKENKTKPKVNVLSTTNKKCSHCKQDHSLYKCNEFLKLSVDDRLARLKELKLCLNCLGIGHWIDKCKVNKKCFTCNGRHNTLLHRDVVDKTVVATASTKQIVGSEDALGILATANVWVGADRSSSFKGRVLLDCGSQSSLITESFAKKCGAKFATTDVTILGISSRECRIRKKCSLRLMSMNSGFELTVEFYVVKHITEEIPMPTINIKTDELPKAFPLADPGFKTPGDVNILLGSSMFWDVIQPAKVKINEFISLQSTVFGWLVVGRTPAVDRGLCFMSNVQLSNSIRNYFEIENAVLDEKVLSVEEKLCEKIFEETTTVGKDGKFIVTIPLRDSVDLLGDSKEQAIRRFLALEKRLERQPKVKQEYIKFMREYESLGHMLEVTGETQEKCYYMPHHCVLKSENVSTKLRVVFDASAASSSGVSLNDIECTGPVVQGELYDTLVRFRQHLYVLCCDIEKMYRQIWVSRNQVNLQRIIWRESPNHELKIYILLTVTYGTRSAPYLATRSLKEAGKRCFVEYPKVSQIIEEDGYIDDYLTGSDSIENLKLLKEQLQIVLERSGFNLHKFKSNCAELLEIESSSSTHQFTDPNTKMLGIKWDCEEDMFSFQIKELSPVPKFTKRFILADISSIFDPLGLIGIATITLKIFMQQLWIHANGWDDDIGADLQVYWRELRSDIVRLNEVKVPRQISLPNAVVIELHGFADASELAFGCCVYLRAVSSENVVQTRLISSKSRVAPIKKQSIPRLELNAATLLSELMDRISKTLRLDIKNKFYWTDSTIVLHWIATLPNKLQTYVGNRVAKVQTLTNIADWRHVPGTSNPADLLSRGVQPSMVASETLWWQGPPWLELDSENWPKLELVFDKEPIESKMPKVLTVTVKCDLFSKYSCLNKMQRVLAYCKRFIANCKLTKENRNLGPMTVPELDESVMNLIKLAQLEMFPEEIKILLSRDKLKSTSRILTLAPFIDDSGILRVGGRLKNADLPLQVKHPVLLQANHPFCKMLFKREHVRQMQEHVRQMHAAPQLLLYSIREGYWILGGRNLARTTVHNCLKCFRHSNPSIAPMMSDLPSTRVQASLPFTHVGTDFAGPFQLKDRIGRGAKTYKGYVCLFICFATKAVHLELVTALSSEAFIAVLRRFMSRRGRPNVIYSDNGTNYVGACKELGDFIKRSSGEITQQSAVDGIRWQFIPPRSPHFGGLWERGIQSVKFHLRRVMTERVLIYEHFVTLLTGVEAVLNSRPLTPMSPDPHDLQALTPAHFLLGRSMLTIPDNDEIQIPENRRNLYQQMQAIQQHFWLRWHKEYLSGLQERNMETEQWFSDCWRFGSHQRGQSSSDGLEIGAHLTCTSRR